jgi:hypothetical protein
MLADHVYRKVADPFVVTARAKLKLIEAALPQTLFPFSRSVWTSRAEPAVC